MARTRKADRLHQAEMAAIRHRRQVLEAIAAMCHSVETPTRNDAERAARDFGVKVDDIMNERGRLW